MKNISLPIDIELFDRLKKIATKERRTLVSEIRKILYDNIDILDPIDPAEEQARLDAEALQINAEAMMDENPDEARGLVHEEEIREVVEADDPVNIPDEE